jgi:hypothetical protein
MDINVRAFRTVQAALAEPEAPNRHRDSARKGGLRGGPSRAKALTRAQRIAIAKKASAARWKTSGTVTS